VLHRRGDRAVRIGAGRHLASRIAQARFVPSVANMTRRKLSCLLICINA